MLRWLSFALIALFYAATPAAAQETQVPLDEGGRVQVVDLALARQLGLWVDEYPDFREARLFQSPDGSFVLEVTTERQGRVARQRVPLTAAEAAALRRDVTARLAERAPRAGMDQRGRYLLMGQTTLAGVAFYGWALPYSLDLDDTAAAGAYLLTASASFFLPFALTQDQPVSYGMANLSRYGITRGTAHGLLLYNLLEGEEEEVDCGEGCYINVTNDDRARFALAMLGSVAEGVGGYLWARNEEMTAGTVNAISLAGDAGLLWGLGTAFIVGTDDVNERVTAAIALPAAAAGIVAGHQLAARRNYVWGDVDLMYTGGALGAYTGLAAMELFDVTDDETVVAASMLGSAAALYLADRLVRETDFTVGQASLNRLGTLAGGLAGASIGVMAEDEKLAVVGSALGAIGGYLGTYRLLAPQAREQRGDVVSSLHVQLLPQSLLGAALGSRSESAPAVPCFRVDYRFGGR